MYLRNIKLVGFKSFVDATTVPIKSNMNGIVGPNGCGKSNIIDAVRWVIGELSAKQLRGQSMADVIFNGTNSRKPVGKAQVELQFDNSDGRLVGEYAKFTDIAIRREVFREGQSNYFINGTSCRRRDILDLFYGTGLGPRSYSIIEQGMISRLIEAKPEDMRNHLEEAAGISKYKERRRETENRMKRTQENLDRLNDLREEIEKQLRHLKRQANAAERYKTFKEEEREVNAQIKALQWQVLETEAGTVDATIHEQDMAKEALKTEHGRIDADMEKARIAQSDATQSHHAAQKAYYSHASDLARIEQRIQSTQAEMGRWQQELEESDVLWDDLRDSTEEHAAQASELTMEVATLKPQATTFIEQAQSAKTALLDAEHAMQQWQQSWERYQSQYTENQKQGEVSRTQRRHIQQQSEELAARIVTLREQLAVIDLPELESGLVPLQGAFSQTQTELATLNGTIDDVNDKLQQQRDRNHAMQSTINAQRETLQTRQGRQASLEALQESAMEDHHEAVQSWLSAQGLAKQPRLGKTLRVASGWEVAVETVLAGALDAVCVDDLNLSAAALADLSAGQLTMITQGTAAPTEARFDTLASKVGGEWSCAAWLHGIYVAENIETAMAARHQLAAHESFITPDGVWVGAYWLRVAKTVNAESSVLLREQALQALIAEIATEKSHLAEQEKALATGEAALLALESQRENLHQKRQSLTDAIAAQQRELAEREAAYKTAKSEQTRLQDTLRVSTERAAQLETQQTETLAQLEAAETQAAELMAERERLQTARATIEQALSEKRNAYQAAKQRVDEYDIRLSATESQLGLLQQTMTRAEKQLQQLSERRDELNHNLADVDGPLATLREELQLQLEQQSVLERALREAAAALEAANEAIVALDASKEGLGERAHAVDQLLEKARMDRQAITIRQSTIAEQLQEADIVLETVLAELPEAANMPEWQSRSEELATRISRLGPINLAAIDEHTTLTERKEYIDKQHADLTEALSVLEEAIRKIDRETKQKFKDTFDKVNAEFAALFPRIFGGGTAGLALEEGEDLLTAGVIVKAQPPGKRNSTIHMLSGGEKALTALALVFSFFQLNPAPFCILDEVDAPLDDLNVGRFCRLIKEMSDKTQFIVISHNKVTIESVDYLMGITMQEPGVSRLVSVDIEAAIEMAEA